MIFRWLRKRRQEANNAMVQELVMGMSKENRERLENGWTYNMFTGQWTSPQDREQR